MMTMVISGSDGVTFPDSTNQFSGGAFSFKNRIINGDMRIDQRNAGAAVTPDGSAPYSLDRWRTQNATDGAFTVQQVTDAPSGFTNSLKATTTTADASLTGTQGARIWQPIEGFNVSDLDFGTANAKTFTLSFWIKSSLTGTFGGAFSGSTEYYPFTYSISVVDTWEYKTVTVVGSTSGTWNTTNGVGLNVWFGLGSGPDRSGTAGAWTTSTVTTATGVVNPISTLNATWYITGVQLEVGSVATPFERRPYGTELALCQRYYAKTFLQETAPAQNAGTTNAIFSRATVAGQPITAHWKLPVTMRAAPTLTTFNPSAANANWAANPSSPVVASNLGTEVISIFGTTNTVAGNGYSIHATAEIEL
jgi:hypothetical protein